jgi:hypothetical protein
VNDAISQADNSSPLNSGMFTPNILGYSISGFADDFQIADNRVDRLVVFYKRVTIQARNVTLDLLIDSRMSSIRSGADLRDID